MNPAARRWRSLIVAAIAAAPALAQMPAVEPNDGTDPARPIRSAALSFEYRALPGGDTEQSLFADLSLPLGDGLTVLAARLPFIAVESAANGLGLGDLGIEVSRVLPTDRNGAIILGGGLEFPTAGSPERGAGQTVAVARVIIERNLPGGTIVAPTATHSVGLSGGGDRVRFTRLNLYIVPTLMPEHFYLTIDPAFTRDWAEDSSYADMALTIGYTFDRPGSPDPQIFLRPGAGIGADRSFAWAIEIGIQLLDF